MAIQRTWWKMVLRSRFVLFASPLLFFVSCSPNKEANSDNKEVAVKEINAERLFAIHCAPCHKPDGTGGISGSKNLTISQLDHASTVQFIADGKGDMMPFKDMLSKAELEALADYIETLRKTK
jgi:mono/diheme cytochrome c family protein